MSALCRWQGGKCHCVARAINSIVNSQRVAVREQNLRLAKTCLTEQNIQTT